MNELADHRPRPRCGKFFCPRTVVDGAVKDLCAGVEVVSPENIDWQRRRARNGRDRGVFLNGGRGRRRREGKGEFFFLLHEGRGGG
jgi:hypothetical protein